MVRRRVFEKAELLDEDEQKKLVHELVANNQTQTEDIERIFVLLCWAAAVVAVLATILEQGRDHHISSMEAIQWIHTLACAALHWKTPLVAKADYTLCTQLAIGNVVVTAIALFAARSAGSQGSHLHMQLLVSNIILMAAAVWVQYENGAMDKSVSELQASKYSFKSL